VSLSAGLRAGAAALWDAQHAHPFVRGIGDGTLPEAAFRAYIRQDYVFLVDYGRLLSLAAARAPDLATMRRLAELAHETLGREMALHRGLAQRWGIRPAELEAAPPAPATAAYADFLLRTAALGDVAELLAALLPCVWGYAEIGARLHAAGLPDHDGYVAWIATYADPEFQRLAGWAREAVDRAAADVAGAGLDRMRTAFVRSSEHELAFWQSAWDARG
jgi:thiaminase/transcriptional activator TenA